MSGNSNNYLFRLIHFTKLTLTFRYLNNCFGSIKLTDSFSFNQTQKSIQSTEVNIAVEVLSLHS